MLPSLRRRMMWRVLLPLALTWLLGSAVVLTVAYVYIRKAFDRSLLDDAYEIATNVSTHDGELTFTLTPREAAAALFDNDEKVFFAVLRPDGTLVAGQGGLREPPIEPREPWVFEARHYRGVDLRMVTLWREQPLPHAVVVAQTHAQPLATCRATAGGGAGAAGRTAAGAGSVAAALDRPRNCSPGGPGARTGSARHQRPDAGEPGAAVARHRAPGRRLQRHDGADRRGGAHAARIRRQCRPRIAHPAGRHPVAGSLGLAQKDPSVWAAQLRSIIQSEARASHLVEQLLALALADEARTSPAHRGPCGRCRRAGHAAAADGPRRCRGGRPRSGRHRRAALGAGQPGAARRRAGQPDRQRVALWQPAARRRKAAGDGGAGSRRVPSCC